MIFSEIEKMKVGVRGVISTAVAPAILALLVLSSLANLPLEPGECQALGAAWLEQSVSYRQEGPTVSLSPAESQVEPGDAFTVEVVVEGVSDLGAFELKVTFPPGIVRARDVGLGDFLGSTGRNATALGPSLDNEAGTVTFGAFTLGEADGPTGTGTLATVTFEAVQQGGGPLGLMDVQLTDTAARGITARSVDASIGVGREPSAQTPTSPPSVEPSQPPGPTAPPTNTPVVVQTLEASTPTLSAQIATTEEGQTPGTDILPSATPTPHPTPSPTRGARGLGRAGTRLTVVGAVSIALIGLIVLIVGYLLYRKR